MKSLYILVLFFLSFEVAESQNCGDLLDINDSIFTIVDSSLHYQIAFSNDSIYKRFTIYFLDGTINSKTYNNKLTRCCKYVEWYENGNIREISYDKNDKPYGISKVWFKNGQLANKYEFKNGHPCGKYSLWHYNGKLAATGSFFYLDSDTLIGLVIDTCEYIECIDGENREDDIYVRYFDRPHGVWKEFYDNGKKKSETYYEMGRKIGLWRFWLKNGNLFLEREYENDKLINEKKYCECPHTKIE